MMTPQKQWRKIPWEGNPALGFTVWRKKFGRGHVSIGCGDFKNVVFSYGANSDDSYSGTRWDYGRPAITEQEAMDAVDRGNGKRMIFNRTPEQDAARERQRAEDAAFFNRNKEPKS